VKLLKNADISLVDFHCNRLVTYAHIYGSVLSLTALVYDSLVINVTGSFQGGKRKRCEVNQSFPSRAEIRMEL
jgi:hypothetical protein